MQDVGVAFARDGEQMLVVMAFAQSLTLAKTFTGLPDEKGDVVIEGMAPKRIQRIFRLRQPRPVRRRLVFIGSAPDVAALSPDLQRPAGGRNGVDRAELFQTGGTYLARYAELIARRPNLSSLEYREQIVETPHPATSAEEFTFALVKELNAIRAQEGLPTVGISFEESKTAARMASHFFVEGTGDIESTQDSRTIISGLLAGWHVNGMIREGQVVANELAGWRRPAMAVLHLGLSARSGRADEREHRTGRGRRRAEVRAGRRGGDCDRLSVPSRQGSSSWTEGRLLLKAVAARAGS